jgi:hypothetical protein
MEDLKTGTNSSSRLIQQESMGMSDVCRDFLRNVVNVYKIYSLLRSLIKFLVY